MQQALKRYVDLHGYQADWSAVDDAPPEALVNLVSAVCPFDALAKQALLEAPDLKSRAEILIAVTEIELAKKTAGTSGETPLQ